MTVESTLDWAEPGTDTESKKRKKEKKRSK
jgi:hypothetical protein